MKRLFGLALIALMIGRTSCDENEVGDAGDTLWVSAVQHNGTPTPIEGFIKVRVTVSGGSGGYNLIYNNTVAPFNSDTLVLSSTVPVNVMYGGTYELQVEDNFGEGTGSTTITVSGEDNVCCSNPHPSINPGCYNSGVAFGMYLADWVAYWENSGCTCN